MDTNGLTPELIEEYKNMSDAEIKETLITQYETAIKKTWEQIVKIEGKDVSMGIIPKKYPKFNELCKDLDELRSL